MDMIESYLFRYKINKIFLFYVILSTFGGRGGNSVEYHSELQGIVQDSNRHPNNMLGHLLQGCLALHPASELACLTG